jgi:hypothetical protein
LFKIKAASTTRVERKKESLQMQGRNLERRLAMLVAPTGTGSGVDAAPRRARTSTGKQAQQRGG